MWRPSSSTWARPIEVEDASKQRALHVAAANDAVHVAGLLIERGAEIDPYELNYSNTPLDFAVYYDYARMIDLLRPHSRDVWNLTPIGAIERLREIIPSDPRLAKVSWQTTPLFWLPEDEDKALEIARLFLEHGADPNFRSKKDGSTAADIARQRGMHRVADLLDAARGEVPDDDTARREHLLATYEQLAHDVAAVYESDDAEALERLGRQFNRILSFDYVRTLVRSRVDRLRQAAAAHLELEEARELIAQQAGFKTWAAFLESVAPTGTAGRPARSRGTKITPGRPGLRECLRARPRRAPAPERVLRTLLHFRGCARGNLAPRVRLPRAFFPGAEKLLCSFPKPK